VEVMIANSRETEEKRKKHRRALGNRGNLFGYWMMVVIGAITKHFMFIIMMTTFITIFVTASAIGTL
jgi:hypothetical protein